MYNERYVAFVDILGFSAIVRKTGYDTTPNRITALVNALTEIGSHHPAINESDDFQFQSFSDSIVMSSASTFTGLLHILHSISDLSIRLLRTGLLTLWRDSQGQASPRPSCNLRTSFFRRV